jgi:hypothetical protein
MVGINGKNQKCPALYRTSGENRDKGEELVDGPY